MQRILLESLMITGFVAGMMLVVEYLNVLSAGRWRQRLGRSRGGQYLLAALLGAAPGCLGAFTVVTMYSHGALTFGSVVAGMIAASGDEAFVMLALIPKQALLLAGLLVLLAIAAGALTDYLTRGRTVPAPPCDSLAIHEAPASHCFAHGRIVAQWKECSAARGVLAVSLALFALAVAAGWLGEGEWGWVRISLLAVSAASLFVVATVSDHFLEEHLWRHVARKHAPRVFLWTLAALAASGPLERLLQVTGNVRESHWLLLAAACLVGVIPESGPHLVFVTLYAQHAIPFSVLLANSVVQDGHGMLPMLAHSRAAFLAVKAVNLVVGLAAGAAAMGLGF